MKKQSLVEHVKIKTEVKQIIIIRNWRNLDEGEDMMIT